MTLQTNDTITKQDVVNYFNTNVVDVAFNGINYHSGNVPTFTSENASGAQAIPSTQLSNTTKPSMTVDNIPDNLITASTIINAMKNIATNCSRIRNTICRSYFDTDGTYNLQQTLTGKAVYLATTPAISGSTVPYYTKTPNTTQMTVDSSAAVPNELAIDKIAAAVSVTQFITNLVNEWNTRYNTTVTFNYYICHSQCHSNCHTRARR